MTRVMLMTELVLLGSFRFYNVVQLHGLGRASLHIKKYEDYKGNCMMVSRLLALSNTQSLLQARKSHRQRSSLKRFF